MAEVKWIKIVTDIFDDEKIRFIETMPGGDGIIVIWFKLICLAGKSNSNGMLMMTDRIAYTDDMLSSLFSRDKKEIDLALKIFEQLDMIEMINNRIYLVNWEKHQSAEKLEKIREQTRKRVSDHRARQIESNAKSVTGALQERYGNATDKEEDKDKEEDIDTKPTAFDLFWAAYPKKIGKAAAKKAFAKVPNSAHPLLVPAVEAHKQSSQWQKDNGQYIPNPATWLNQGRWEDELAETTAPTVQPNAAPGRSSNDIRKMIDML